MNFHLSSQLHWLPPKGNWSDSSDFSQRMKVWQNIYFLIDIIHKSMEVKEFFHHQEMVGLLPQLLYPRATMAHTDVIRFQDSLCILTSANAHYQLAPSSPGGLSPPSTSLKLSTAWLFLADWSEEVSIACSSSAAAYLSRSSPSERVSGVSSWYECPRSFLSYRWRTSLAAPASSVSAVLLQCQPGWKRCDLINQLKQHASTIIE